VGRAVAGGWRTEAGAEIYQGRHGDTEPAVHHRASLAGILRQWTEADALQGGSGMMGDSNVVAMGGLYAGR